MNEIVENSSASASNPQAQELEKIFKTFLILYLVAVPLCCILIGIIPMIIAMVYWCKLIYRLWDLLPESSRSGNSPGEMVGYNFIPFFNLYWQFKSIHGLGKALNEELDSRDIKLNRVNLDLTLAYCILGCICFIPYLGLLAVLGFIPIMIITLNQMKSAGVALLNDTTA